MESQQLMGSSSAKPAGASCPEMLPAPGASWGLQGAIPPCQPLQATSTSHPWEKGARGSLGSTTFQKTCGCGAWGHGLGVTMVVLGSVTSEGFSSLSHSMIPRFGKGRVWLAVPSQRCRAGGSCPRKVTWGQGRAVPAPGTPPGCATLQSSSPESCQSRQLEKTPEKSRCQSWRSSSAVLQGHLQTNRGR